MTKRKSNIKSIVVIVIGITLLFGGLLYFTNREQLPAPLGGTKLNETIYVNVHGLVGGSCSYYVHDDQGNTNGEKCIDNGVKDVFSKHKSEIEKFYDDNEYGGKSWSASNGTLLAKITGEFQIKNEERSAGVYPNAPRVTKQVVYIDKVESIEFLTVKD